MDFHFSIYFLFRNLEEISDLQLKLKEEQQHFNQLKVSKDLELEGIKTSEGQLREVNEQLKIDLQRYVTQPEFTCSKLAIETLEQGVKYVQS